MNTWRQLLLPCLAFVLVSALVATPQQGGGTGGGTGGATTGGTTGATTGGQTTGGQTTGGQTTGGQTTGGQTTGGQTTGGQATGGQTTGGEINDPFRIIPGLKPGEVRRTDQATMGKEKERAPELLNFGDAYFQVARDQIDAMRRALGMSVASRGARKAANMQDARSEDRSALIKDPNTGRLIDPVTGAQYDAVTGFSIDARSGESIDAVTGLYLDRVTGHLVDPVTNERYDRMTGRSIDPERNQVQIDLKTGERINTRTNERSKPVLPVRVDPRTGDRIDPITGERMARTQGSESGAGQRQGTGQAGAGERTESRRAAETGATGSEQGASADNRQPMARPGESVSPQGSLVWGNMVATAAENYQLGPGDRLTARVWSPTMDPKEFNIVVDKSGGVNAPGTERRVILRGQTLAQAEALLRREARQGIRDAEVTLELAGLRTFQVSVLGESYAPGNYTVPATASLFNLLYATGGPTELGSLRTIQLRRQNAKMMEFDIYKLLILGDSTQDVPLQPGDVILIPPAKVRVAIRGEVVRPAVYEITEKENLKTALEYAGGIRASGVTQSISVESTLPGRERRLLTVDTARQQAAAVSLFDGDIVDIFSVQPIIRNSVLIEGAVDQPRSYALTPGMRVKDLITVARGLMPNAFLDRANLFRVNLDKTVALIAIDLRRMEQNDPEHNVVLKPDDRVFIFQQEDVKWLGDRQVVIQGAVQRPGAIYRADNMRLKDALLIAGGPVGAAFAERAFLQRVNADGTLGPLLQIDLTKAIGGDPEHNVVLQDRDRVRVLTTREANFISDQTVEVLGAVQRPGTFPLASNMRVRDLILLSGNLLPDAFMEKAFLQRVNPNGTNGPLVTVNLAALMQGDETQNITLQSRDRLSVYKLEDAKFMADESVRIVGAVQRSDSYPLSQNMKLSDLIALAGGVQPNHAPFLEVMRARRPTGQEPQRVPISSENGVIQIQEDLQLFPGDLVSIPSDSSIILRPKSVTLIGRVRNPGVYPIKHESETISDVVARAGGFVEEAWLEGAQFARDPRFLKTVIQDRLVPRAREVLKVIQEDEYRRALARTDIDRIRLISLAQASAASGGMGILGAPSGGSTQPVGIPPISSNAQLVTPARQASAFEDVQGGNLAIDVSTAVRRPKSAQDLVLQDGDVITIPAKPATVFMDGPGILLKQAVIYQPGKNLAYYLREAGGFTQDASPSEVIIIRPSGTIFKPRLTTRINLGDVVYVPTKAQMARLKDSQVDVENTLKIITSGALVYGLIRGLR